jgi:hypothetical protein
MGITAGTDGLEPAVVRERIEVVEARDWTRWSLDWGYSGGPN